MACINDSCLDADINTHTRMIHTRVHAHAHRDKSVYKHYTWPSCWFQSFYYITISALTVIEFAFKMVVLLGGILVFTYLFSHPLHHYPDPVSITIEITSLHPRYISVNTTTAITKLIFIIVISITIHCSVLLTEVHISCIGLQQRQFIFHLNSFFSNRNFILGMLVKEITFDKSSKIYV